MNEHKKRVLEEEHFRYIDLTYEEAHNYLNILNNCKEIKDSIFKVDDSSIGKIVDISLKKENNNILFDGFVNYGKENRAISGVIYTKNELVVDMHINRLCVKENNVYTTIDEFKDDEHVTMYNNSLGTYKDKIIK